MAYYSVALLVYGETNSTRNALAEEKYKDLADAFVSDGFKISSVLYNDEKAGELLLQLCDYDAVLVWVNPIEQGRDRKRLEALLTEVAERGRFVSTHPEVILKMGTKDVLFRTKDMEWGCDTDIYTSFEDFTKRFPEKLKLHGTRVLKQHRGNGGNGVYKLVYTGDDTVTVIHAIAGHKHEHYSIDQLFAFFEPFFDNNGLLIDQEWNKNIINGMVRCYVAGTKVSGFGYQEINALYELNNNGANVYVPPGRRYYFTEHCGLFSDLKKTMEEEWIGQLQKQLSIPTEKMPVIWDADFFINHTGNTANGKYTICEINVSSVSPFPPSSIPHIVQLVNERLGR